MQEVVQPTESEGWGTSDIFQSSRRVTDVQMMFNCECDFSLSLTKCFSSLLLSIAQL